ncbi:MAG: hypothetical protein ACYTG1_04520 [Planctomycetota bacterium]|jgi:hypothetical protein
MKQVIHDLERLRSRGRAMLLTQRTSVLLAVLLAALLAVVLVDYGLRLPRGLRLAILVGAAGALAWSIWRHVRTAVLFRPTLTQLALRVERTTPRVAGRLASSVEFAAAGIDRTNPLAARSVHDTEARLRGESLGAVLRPSRTLRDVGVLALVAVVVAGASWLNPAGAATGARRLLLPLGATEWPARTGVESRMNDVLIRPGVHPRGEALPLRAQVIRGDDDQRVDAHYRVRTADGAWRWERIVLTHQGDGLHERLIDAAGESIELWFETDDARTTRERIRLVPPPAVVAAALRVTPPAYASGRVAPYEAALGPGVDERAVTDTPSLVGSDVELVIDLNKPLPVPDDPGPRRAWLRDVLGWDDDALRFDPDPEAPRWTLRWRLRGTRTVDLRLEDEHGLANVEPIGYRIDAVEDRGPGVSITEPQTDEAVLATAVVPLRAEAQDDVAVASVALEATVTRAAADPSAPETVPDADGDAAGDDGADAAVPWREEQHADAASARFETELDLNGLELAEGDVVEVTAVAADMYEMDGERHEPARSLPRRLRVMGELEFAGQLRRQLAAVRQNAIRIESIQGELQQDVVEQGVLPGMNRPQAQIAERIAAQGDVVDAIEEQLRRNRLDDAALADLLRQSRAFLDVAGRSASRAVEAIEQRAGAAPAGAPPAGERTTPGRPGGPESPREGDDGATPPPDGADAAPGAPERGERDEAPDFDRPDQPMEADEADQPVVDAQQEVRDELADLIELLDRDEDTWVVTRRLEGLLDEQQRLQEATARLGEQTIGLETSQLTDEQRSELDRIEERQRDLREQTRPLVEDLRERAEDLQEVDPQSSAGMRRAADTAERRELDRAMGAAAERVESNRMQMATGDQQSAIDTMQKMLEDMEEGKRARAEDLLRRLASLLESIERLILVQRAELESLAAARATGDFSGRDRAMIRLNQNTFAVAGEARAAGAPARRIARTLDRAADAQGAAVTALRARPIDADAAQEAEQQSLELLEEAKRLTEELQQQTEEEEVRRRREELLAAYRELAERQVAVRDDVVDLAADPPDPRETLITARRLGHRQDEVRTALTELRDATEEVAESPVFSHAHRLMDEWSRQASERLWEGGTGTDVTDRQQLVADAIGRLIEALEESMQPPEEFEENQSGGGAGAQSPPPLIPPVAELKLLRGLQEQVYDQTRDLDQRDDLDPGASRQRLRDLGQQQRELHDLGAEMLERLEQQQQGMPAGVQPGAGADR